MCEYETVVQLSVTDGLCHAVVPAADGDISRAVYHGEERGLSHFLLTKPLIEFIFPFLNAKKQKQNIPR